MRKAIGVVSAWLVFYFCYLATYYVQYFLTLVVLWGNAKLYQFSGLLYWLFLLSGGIAVLSIVLLPLFFGPSLSIKASEAVMPSKNGLRYRILSVTLIILAGIRLISMAFSASSIDRMIIISVLLDVYIIIFSVIVLTTSKDIFARKEQIIEEGSDQLTIWRT